MTHFKGVSGGRLNVAVISAGDYFLPSLLGGSARSCCTAAEPSAGGIFNERSAGR